MNSRVDLAVTAFRDAEKARLLLDKKERDLREAVVGMTAEEKADYVEMTESILREYEEKREKAGLS